LEAKILILDIETAPIKAYVWSLWKQNIGLNQIIDDWKIITYSAKWLGAEDVYWDSTEGDKDERRLLGTLWDLLDEADIIVAHNGDRFDIAKINGKFLEHKMPPYSPIKTIDTLKAVKARFALTSNKLDYISKYLGFEGKLQTGGMQLWIDCMNGVHRAWKQMVEYNIQDVVELENVYVEIRPWITNHPNVALYNNEVDPVCPKCGGSDIHFRGYAYTGVSKFRRFQCQDCGGWGRLATNELSKEKRKGLTRNVSK